MFFQKLALILLLKTSMCILASLLAPLIERAMNLECSFFGAHCAVLRRDGVLEQTFQFDNGLW